MRLNLETYLECYDRSSFRTEPFNDIDNLILSMVPYVNLHGIVPNEGSITLRKASEKFFRQHSSLENRLQIRAVRQAINLFQKAAECRRFANIKLSHYVYEIEKGSQFCALRMDLEDESVYIAFEGTDGNIVGWEEDFQLAYTFPTISQQKAVNYLNHVVKFQDHLVRVGGHSKGGNLAMVASMYSKRRVKRRIKMVYNNDGPGLREKQFNSLKYRRMLPKLRMIVPENSMVGMILNHPSNYLVVKSTAKGIFCHDGTTWCCYGNRFLEGTQTKNSKTMEKSFAAWLKQLDDTKRQNFSKEIFQVFHKAGIEDINDIRLSKLNNVLKIIKEVSHMPKESKKMVIDTIKILMDEMK